MGRVQRLKGKKLRAEGRGQEAEGRDWAEFKVRESDARTHLPASFCGDPVIQMANECYVLLFQFETELIT